MIFDSDTFTADMLSHPAKTASVIIDALESLDTTGVGLQINDPNNAFVIQTLANCSLAAANSQKIDYTLSYFYPQRARNSTQLFSNLSEFDYVSLMASPATVPFVFALSKDWIVQNSVYFDANYNKITIPATSYITMSGVTYSMYYPISILVNRNTGSVTAFYDNSAVNSLSALTTNMLLDVQEFTSNGLAMFQIMFNMYQFTRTPTSITVGREEGFSRQLSYVDQFYAVKVFTQNSDGSLTELNYSLSEKFYDYKTPTALLILQPESNQITVKIPQIYFDNGEITQTIVVELYTTKGAVNYALGEADLKGIQANFDTKSSPFAAPLASPPTWTLLPTEAQVIGGSDSKSFDDIRSAVVNQKLYKRVAITTPELMAAFDKAGFVGSRLIDNLTERVYTASNILSDPLGITVPTFAGKILIAGDALHGDPSTILDFSDGYYTLLPTTTFQIASNGTTCVPMTDGQVTAMQAMTNEQLVAELNKGTYVRQPFHITLLTSPKSPQTLIYNLLTPTSASLQFINENAHSAPQLSVIACNLLHLANGTGGYQVQLTVVRSSNIQTIDHKFLNLYLTCFTKTGYFAYLPATYVSTANGVDLWVVTLGTNYHISVDDYLTVSMFDQNDTERNAEIKLSQSFTLVSSFVSSYDSTIPADGTLNLLLPPSVQSTQIAMTQQTVTFNLGQNLSQQIYCAVNTTWGNDVYQTADQTIYYQADTWEFQNTETGIINTRVNTGGGLGVVPLYEPGDTPPALGDFQRTVTSQVTTSVGATSANVTLDDVTGILVGMFVRGTNLGINAAVTKVTGQVVTLSQPVVGTVTVGSSLVFTNPSFLLRTSQAQTKVSAQLTVTSTAGFLVGQTVSGFDIPRGTTIKSVDDQTHFTLSNTPTALIANNALLSIINTTNHGVVKVQQGDVVTDATGAPIIVKDAENQYLIPAILFDSRLFASQSSTDATVINSLADLLQTYANQVATIDEGLTEVSSVFYQPARTMGYAQFDRGNGQTISMSMELNFSVTVYLDATSLNTSALLSTINTVVISVINTEIQKPTISISNITQAIKTALGTTVADVEMGDISGVTGLRTIALQDANATPSIENLLVIQNDGTIVRQPNVAITFQQQPTPSLAKLLS